MAAGFPTKANFATGDVLSATNMNDLAGTVNLLNPSAKGTIFSASAANTPAALAVGTANQVLTVDSSTATGLKWATPSTSSSGLTFIKRATVSAVSDTGTTFDNTFSSTYYDYLIIYENFRCAAGTPTMGLQFLKSGTAYTSGYYGSMIFGTYTATQYLASNAASQFYLSSLNAGSDNSATITVQNAIAASNVVAMTANVQDGATDRYGAGGCGKAGDTFTGFKLLPSSSTFSGTVSVYGYAKA